MYSNGDLVNRLLLTPFLLFFAVDASQSESKALVSTMQTMQNWSYGMSQTQGDAILKDLSQESYFPYQDITINSETIWRGTGPDCSSRYTAIAAALASKYNRPFSVLDIGANNGYFSINLARDYNAQVVMVDTSDRLRKICQYNTDSNKQLLYCKKQMTLDDLSNLPSNTKFDAVLLLNVLHHMPDWKPFIKKMSTIADTLVVENPPVNDPRCSYKTTIPDIQAYLQKMNAPIIARTPRTKPGYYSSLPAMKYGMQLDVPTLPDVQSIMQVVHSGNSQIMSPLHKDMFKDQNVVFAGENFNGTSL